MNLITLYNIINCVIAFMVGSDRYADSFWFVDDKASLISECI